MQAYEKLGEAVVDVTRPAFLGIAEWEAGQVEEMGFELAATYLQDFGYEVMEGSIGGVDAPHALAARDADGEVAVVRVVARRLLGYAPEEIPSITPEPDAELVSMVSKLVGDVPVRPVGVVISFLSERVAHIAKITYPLPE